MLKQIALTMTVITILASCGDNSSTTNTETESYKQPKDGSSLTTVSYLLDTIASQPVNTTCDTLKWTVLKTKSEYFGKTNITEFNTKNPLLNVSEYINYETNNDISRYEARMLENGRLVEKWITFPIAGKTSITTVLYDSTKVVSGIAISTKIAVTISHEKNETINIKGKPVNTVKFKKVTEFINITDGVTEKDSSVNYHYFAPSLGYFVKEESPVSVNSSGQKLFGYEVVVIDYDYK